MMFDTLRDDSDAFDHHPVLWRWTPGPEAKQHRHWDVADEYAVLEVGGDSGVMLMGRYGDRWLANSPSARPVIAELLRRMGTKYTQPPPIPNAGEPVWPEAIRRAQHMPAGLIEDMKERHAFGVRKYGTPLCTDDGRDPISDLYEEALDAYAYAVKGAMQGLPVGFLVDAAEMLLRAAYQEVKAAKVTP